MSLFYQWVKLRYPRATRWLVIVIALIGSLFGVLAPVKSPPNLITLTQQVWEKKLGRVIPEAEAVEITRSFRNFLTLIKEIRKNGK